MKNNIHGKNVILRPFREEDAVFFARWYNEPEVMFECGFHEPTTLETELKRIQNPESSDEDWYAIVDRETGRLLGETGLLRMWSHWHCTDMSMIIPNPDDQGKGYGTEAGRQKKVIHRLHFEEFHKRILQAFHCPFHCQQ